MSPKKMTKKGSPAKKFKKPNFNRFHSNCFKKNPKTCFLSKYKSKVTPTKQTTKQLVKLNQSKLKLSSSKVPL